MKVSRISKCVDRPPPNETHFKQTFPHYGMSTNTLHDYPDEDEIIPHILAEEQAAFPFYQQEVKSQRPLSLQSVINRIYQDDCLNCLPLIPDKSVDLILCDLPYGITQNDWDCYIPLEQLWMQYNRIIKDTGVIALTSQGVFTARLILSQPKLFKYKWVWEKSKPTNFLNAKKQPLRKHEDVCIFYKKQPTYNPQMKQGTPYDKGVRKQQLSGSYGDFQPAHVYSDGMRYPTDIIYIKTAESEGPVWHPTQKPVELGRYLVKTYTNPGDVVLDNAFGSGSFLVAALQEGRNFIGIEKNENVALFKKDDVDYIRIALSRLWEAWKKMPSDAKLNLELVNTLHNFNLHCPCHQEQTQMSGV